MLLMHEAIIGLWPRPVCLAPFLTHDPVVTRAGGAGPMSSKFRFAGRGSGRVEIFKFSLYLSSESPEAWVYPLHGVPVAKD
jgi:hypothetical protein